jgi:hypothetical protein
MELDRHCGTRCLTFKFEELSYDQCQSSNTSAYIRSITVINGCKTYYPNPWELAAGSKFPSLLDIVLYK